jgi:hypothetical protein
MIATRSGGVAIGNALASTCPLFAIPLDIVPGRPGVPRAMSCRSQVLAARWLVL